MTAGTESLEIERKYEVAASVGLPAMDAFRSAGFAAEEPVVHELEARYFDTVDGRLARLGLALRSRRGGKDAGWHLKERGDAGVRELAWPPSDEPPAELLAELRARIGDAGIVPIAIVRTERTVVILHDRAGGAVELADDRVRAEDGASGVRRAWREWEAELLAGADPSLLDDLEPVLLAAGAAPSLSPAKIARATGRLVEWARANDASPERIAALEALDETDRAAAA